MEKITAYVTLEVDAECPHCFENIDLMEYNDGQLHGLLTDKVHSNSSIELSNINEQVKCSNCKKTFEVESLDY